MQDRGQLVATKMAQTNLGTRDTTERIYATHAKHNSMQRPVHALLDQTTRLKEKLLEKVKIHKYSAHISCNCTPVCDVLYQAQGR